jgi:hypothetical protein
MLISKEARSAACEAFDQSYFHDAKDSDERLYIALMAGIEAALAAAPAGAVSIKPLEWVEHGDDAFEWHRAIPPVGNRYNIEDDGFSAKRLTLTVGQLVIGNFEKLETAKSAAQSHYEAAIRSALVPVAAEPVARVDVSYGTDGLIIASFIPSTLPIGTLLYASPVTQAADVPDGWKLVPADPTPEMQAAGFKALGSDRECACDQYDCYLAMIAAAPTPEADGDGFPPFKPCIHVNELAGVAEMILEDVPTITGQEMTVRPLLRMSNDRDIVGFQWDVLALAENTGGEKP